MLGSCLTSVNVGFQRDVKNTKHDTRLERQSERERERVRERERHGACSPAVHCKHIKDIIPNKEGAVYRSQTSWCLASQH